MTSLRWLLYVALCACMPVWHQTMATAYRHVINHRAVTEMSGLSYVEEEHKTSDSLAATVTANQSNSRKGTKQLSTQPDSQPTHQEWPEWQAIAFSVAINANFLDQLLHQELTEVLKAVGFAKVFVPADAKIRMLPVPPEEMTEVDDGIGLEKHAVKAVLSGITAQLPFNHTISFSAEVNVHLTTAEGGDFIEFRPRKLTPGNAESLGGIAGLLSDFFLHFKQQKHFPRRFILEGKQDFYDARIVRLGVDDSGSVGIGFVVRSRRQEFADVPMNIPSYFLLPFEQVKSSSEQGDRAKAAIFFDKGTPEFLQFDRNDTEILAWATGVAEFPGVKQLLASQYGGKTLADVINNVLDCTGITKNSRLSDIQISAQHSGNHFFRYERKGTYITLDSTNGGQGLLDSLFQPHELHDMLSHYLA